MTTIRSYGLAQEKLNLRVAIKSLPNPATAVNEGMENARGKLTFVSSQFVHIKIALSSLVLSRNLLVIFESISATKNSGEILVRF